jgi:acyl-coenzyme A thioesterase PaaI-like protein
VDKNSFFWKMADGRLPPPPCAKTLGLEFIKIDGERGTIETRFEAVGIFLNPAGNVQGGFLAAMLDDTMGTALSATLDRPVRADGESQRAISPAGSGGSPERPWPCRDAGP